jgi:hypothetical protein
VADFGAVGDGVTDDAEAIQDAINHAISLGNAIIEFEPKTYKLINFKTPTLGSISPLNANRVHMEIVGGTSSTRIIFSGNNAKLYTDQVADNTLSYFFGITSELFSIEFHNFTFERGPQTRGENGNAYWAGDSFIAMRPVSTNPIDHLTCKNVTFVNGMAAVIENQGYSTSKTYRKLRLVEWLNCKHLHPKGSGANRTSGGGQMLNLSSWVETLNADGVYADGAVNGKIGNDVTFPVDGWLYMNPYHTQISNSHFRNMWVEAVFLHGPFARVAPLQSFVQPAVGSQVTVTVGSMFNSNEELIVGKLYTMIWTNNANNLFASQNLWRTWTAGVYRVDAAPSPIVSNQSQVTLTRMPDSLIFPLDSARTELQEGVTAGTTIPYAELTLFEIGREATGSVTNCTFVSDPVITRENGSSRLFRIRVTNGGSGYTSSPTVTISGGGSAIGTANISGGSVQSISLNAGAHFYTTQPSVTIEGGNGIGATAVAEFYDWRMGPAIMAGTPCTISNCYFDCGSSIRLNPTGSLCRSGFSIINGNVINNTKSKLVGAVLFDPNNQMSMPNSIIDNNIFFTDDATTGSSLTIGRQGVTVSNNIFYAIKSAEAGQQTSAITTINSGGDASSQWQTYVNNNYFYGYNYGISGLSPVILGQMRGSFVTAPTNIFYQTKGSELFLISPNNTRYTLSVTNDGELQITA